MLNPVLFCETIICQQVINIGFPVILTVRNKIETNIILCLKFQAKIGLHVVEEICLETFGVHCTNNVGLLGN